MPASPVTPEAGSIRPHLEAQRHRILFLLVVASLVPLLAIGTGAWAVFGGIIARKAEAHQQTIVRDHAAAVDLYLAERLAALAIVSRTTGRAALTAPGALRAVLADLNASYAGAFQDLGVIADDGRHLAYAGPYDLLGKNYLAAPWFDHVRREGTYISDVFLGFRKVPHFIMAVRHDEPDGFWILRASVDSEQFDALVARGRSGKTGDCFVVDAEGRYQTPPLDVDAKVMDASDVDVKAAIGDGRTVRARARDGRKLTRTAQWIKGGTWLLVAQQDLAEARAPVRRAMAGGMAVFVLGALLVVVTSSITTRRLFRLLEKTQAAKETLDVQLLQASKLATVGEMATGLAHEINNPLAIIHAEQTNVADLLSELDPADPRIAEMRDSVAQTKKQVERCKTITHRMLQFGRQAPGSVTTIDPRKELAEIVRLMATQARVSNADLCLDVGNALPAIHIDPTEFQQVITNLVTNAVQALGGRRGGVVVSGWTEDGALALAVEDTGPGIPAEKLEKVFEPFYTTKAVGQGTGLGLSVCYGIVTKWRGRIRADSGPGRGATFLLRFPAAEAAKP
jgi:two-component system NtrC family sensor kinase